MIISLILQCGDTGVGWENEHGLCEVLLQDEVKVSNLEFLSELEGCVGVDEIVSFAGARYPCIDRRSIRIVAPAA